MNPILAALCVLAIAIIATCIVLAVRWSRRPLWCPNLARQQVQDLYEASLIDASEYRRSLAEIVEREQMEDAA